MVKRDCREHNDRYSNSARSWNIGIVRQDYTRKAWGVVSFVSRFVAALRHRVASRRAILQEGRDLGGFRLCAEFDSTDDGLLSTAEEHRVARQSCSDALNDGQDGDLVGLTGKNDYAVLPNGEILCDGSWQKGDSLGSGSIGNVFKGFTKNGYFFAVKELSLADQGSQGQQSLSCLEQEISILRQLEHENIVRYFGINRDDTKVYIFLELVTQGSLVGLYRKYKLGDSQVSAYTRQILNGLDYLHGRNVVHRDIKCANILVDANASVKLADFGLAKVTTLNDIKSCKGTLRWMAPEVVNQNNYNGYGSAADIWSLGCTVLEMLTGQLPYSDMKAVAALLRIGRGELPHIPDTLSIEAQDFILQCLQVNPDDRPTALQLLKHAFVRK